MAWFVPALLAGLKAAGLGAASAAGSAIGGNLLGGGQGGQNSGMWGSMAPFQNMMPKNAGAYDSRDYLGPQPLSSGPQALTMPGLGMNFAGAFMDSFKNRNKYPTSSGTSQRNQKIIDEGLKNG